MFDDSKTFITLEEAKRVVEAEKSKLQSVIDDNDLKYRSGIRNNQASYTKTINTMKKRAIVNRYYTIYNDTQRITNIGQSIPAKSFGVTLYVGDEVLLHDGSLGIIGYTGHDELAVFTNSSVLFLDLSSSIKGGFNRTITLGDIAISRNYNEFYNGQEIAKGRKGGSGFTVVDVNE